MELGLEICLQLLWPECWWVGGTSGGIPTTFTTTTFISTVFIPTALSRTFIVTHPTTYPSPLPKTPARRQPPSPQADQQLFASSQKWPKWQFLLTSKLPKMATTCFMTEVAKNGNKWLHFIAKNGNNRMICNSIENLSHFFAISAIFISNNAVRKYWPQSCQKWQTNIPATWRQST